MIRRTATLSDLPGLLKLEEYAWKSHLRASSETITDRITKFSEGQFLIEIDEKICGILYTQLIPSVDVLKAGSFSKQSMLHNSENRVLQLMAIAIGGSTVGSIADQLRKQAISYAKKHSITFIVAMTRCSEFPLDNNFDSYQEYVHNSRDPTVFFHRSGNYCATFLFFIQMYMNI